MNAADLNVEVAETFEEASTKGRGVPIFDDALAADLSVVGGGKMPWGDDARFEEWCAAQAPLVRKFFARVVAEREDGARSAVFSDARLPRAIRMRAAKCGKIRTRDVLRWEALYLGGKTLAILPAEIRRCVVSIAHEHSVAPALVVSRLRYKSIARARHHFVAVLRWSSGLSYPEIGSLLDLDHTTVMSAERRWDRELNGEAA